MKLPARYSEKPINLVLDLGLLLAVVGVSSKFLADATGLGGFTTVALALFTAAFLVACLPLLLAIPVLLAEKFGRRPEKQD